MSRFAPWFILSAAVVMVGRRAIALVGKGAKGDPGIGDRMKELVQLDILEGKFYQLLEGHCIDMRTNKLVDKSFCSMPAATTRKT